LYNVVTMYVDEGRTRHNGKTYTRYLLRESYRDEEGRVRHRTVANISSCSPEEIAALKLALAYKDDLSELVVVARDVRLVQGPSAGATLLVKAIAERLGVAEALGSGREGRLALWQVVARLLDQGSRLSATRIAEGYSACDALGLEGFNEEALYGNLDWLAGHQEEIEEALFRRRRRQDKPPTLFLYDVTSSYLEGACNALGAYGYNRDGKRGKKQIVIGLLCEGEGEPVAVKVFAGNTPDVKTFAQAVQTVARRFGCEHVTFVGDRGMIKSEQKGDLEAEAFWHITALTKPQIEGLLAKGTLQMGLFEDVLAEMITPEGQRYVLRRNPERADEMRQTREDKWVRLSQQAEKLNAYLVEHPKAQAETARRKLEAMIGRLRMGRWASVKVEAGKVGVTRDEAAMAEEGRLDGCYALTTDVPPAAADKQTVHDRYKDLAEVEAGFRTCKTAHLEVRPVYVRRESRTRGHVLVVMLAYVLRRELARCWRELDVTVEEGLDELKKLCRIEVAVKGRTAFSQIPEPGDLGRRLLAAASVELPAILLARHAKVATKKKLPSRRTKR